ncbi:MAG TPA: polysaccharide deacetylase family protein [Gemmatimonadales bacterium]|nr:polysaccharide deacetylase family protein [Gemmatimonadales bacterium]
MHSRYIAGLCATLLTALPTGTRVDQPLNVRLGYPASAKLLIINADDLAMSHSENAASLAALDQNLVTSATVMVPAPWFGEVAAYARTHPDADLGLHLTLTAEWQTFRWGPVTPRNLVPSLVGPDGFFYATTDEFVQHAKVDEVETEVRAQIERSKAMGLEPTHLDAHMHSLYATPALFAVLKKVAREYRLPIRMARNEQTFRDLLPYMNATDPPYPDAIFSPLGEVPLNMPAWREYYVNVIENLQPGVTELFVHLAHDDAEMRAVTINYPVWDAAWRQRDLDVISSPEFRRALADNHVILIGWRPIQKLLRD